MSGKGEPRGGAGHYGVLPAGFGLAFAPGRKAGYRSFELPKRMPMKTPILISSVLCASVLLIAACAKTADTASTETKSAAVSTTAVAKLKPAEGQNVSGTVTFTKVADGVRVVADVNGLTPGKHGFHVHEKGDLSAPDLSSAGGHFNPEGEQHGAPGDEHRHVGDLGNLEADANGHATLDVVDHMIALSGKDSIVGHAVIIHGGADDLKSQPSGAAGPRVAGGLIELQ